jgi:UDP-2,3-diacylglucosamine pyrophosphatase LpxH
MNATIVSDLHIGSRYFLFEYFESFLDSIPPDHEIVLNGDIIDNPYADLEPCQQAVLERIEERSYYQEVVWVKGNHDNGYMPRGFGRVRFRPFHTIGDRLLVMHGDQFDEVMPRSQGFVKVFQIMHDLRVKLGAKPVHVAHYAKRWDMFYRVLRRNVMLNAVDCAKANGYGAVACGHTHYAEDSVCDGIRYINTGAWTECPAFYLMVTEKKMTLHVVESPSGFHGKDR